MLRKLFLYGNIFPQELTVADGESAQAINLYYILVKLADLHDEARLI